MESEEEVSHNEPQKEIFDFQLYLKELNLDETIVESNQQNSTLSINQPEAIHQSNILGDESVNKQIIQPNISTLNQEPDCNNPFSTKEQKTSTDKTSSQIMQLDQSQSRENLEISKIQSIISEVQGQKQILRDLNSRQQEVYNQLKRMQVQELESSQSNLYNSGSQLPSSLTSTQTQPGNLNLDNDDQFSMHLKTLQNQIYENNIEPSIQKELNFLIAKIKFQLEVQKQLKYTFLRQNIKTKKQNNNQIQTYYIFSNDIHETEEVLFHFFNKYLKKSALSQNKYGIIVMQKIQNVNNINFSSVNFRLKHQFKTNVSIIFNANSHNAYNFQILDNDTDVKCSFELNENYIQHNIYYVLSNTQANRVLINKIKHVDMKYREYEETLVVVFHSRQDQ